MNFVLLYKAFAPAFSSQALGFHYVPDCWICLCQIIWDFTSV